MFGERLKLARKKAGYSLRGLADALGDEVTAQAIGKYERGEMMPSSGVLMHMARALGDARKIVVSRQHLEFTWRNSEQLIGDLVEAVAALKQEPGEGTIGMSGSVSVVRQLLAAGLIDELHLLVHPIAIRKGMRLFDEGEPPIPLKLLSANTFTTGVLNLVYAPAETTTTASYEDAREHLRQ